jgi:hypothetical protein
MNMPKQSDRLTFRYCVLYTYKHMSCHIFCRMENGEPVMEKTPSGLSVPVYVARTREPLRLSRGDLDQRFPGGLLSKV